jgi:hypothetical protein
MVLLVEFLQYFILKITGKRKAFYELFVVVQVHLRDNVILMFVFHYLRIH